MNESPADRLIRELIETRRPAAEAEEEQIVAGSRRRRSTARYGGCRSVYGFQ